MKTPLPFRLSKNCDILYITATSTRNIDNQTIIRAFHLDGSALVIKVSITQLAIGSCAPSPQRVISIQSQHMKPSAVYFHNMDLFEVFDDLWSVHIVEMTMSQLSFILMLATPN